MNLKLRSALARGATILVVLAAGCAAPSRFDVPGRGALAADIVRGWRKDSRLTAARLMEEYGPPDALSKNGLGWKDKGPWKRIVIWNPAAFERAADQYLEQTVAYAAPEDRRQALEEFNDKARVIEEGAALTACSNAEALNFLAINLAEEIGQGVREPEPARLFYERSVALAASGKNSPYMQGLLFQQKP